MIISNRYRYVFIEIPHTASTAIRNELIEYYDGVSIYSKHAPIDLFIKKASNNEKSYFKFTSIRNPLDIVVTRYFKRKTDHQGFFTNSIHWKEFGGHITQKARREFNFIKNNNATFAEYFKKFYKLPFDNYCNPSPNQFDFIIRYENLQEDFSKLLKILGIRQIRDLPIINKTEGKSNQYLDYYLPEIINKAIWVFAPSMKEWGYTFPEHWEGIKGYRSSQFIFLLLKKRKYFIRQYK